MSSENAEDENVVDAEDSEKHGESNCCDSRCVENLSLDKILMLELMMKCRYPSKKMKKQFLLDFIVANDGSSGIIFNLFGDKVCEEAFLSAYGLSQSLFRKAKRLYKKGMLEVPQISLRQKLQVKSMAAVSWMQIYFQNVCEKAPNSGHWYLPCFLSRESLFKLYKTSDQEQLVSRAQFYQLWRDYYKHVTIPTESRFSKCDLCTAILEEKQKAKTMDKKILLDRMAHQHNELQMAERRAYYDRMQMAKSNPSQCLSLIIDSMDQSKLLVPRLSHQRKATSDSWVLRTHLIGLVPEHRNSEATASLRYNIEDMKIEKCDDERNDHR